MGTSFDQYAEQVFAEVADLMGVCAVWRRPRGGNMEGQVLFKDPSEAVKIGDSASIDYAPSNPVAEYYEGTFPGLKVAVDKGKDYQYLTIEGRRYQVISVETRLDGKTYVAYLEPTK